jgi:hypothetical protein
MHGMGGYTLHTGTAWHWELRTDLRNHATLNTLEFLSTYVGIYMENEFGNVDPLEVLLAQPIACLQWGGYESQTLMPKSNHCIW